MRDTSQPTNGTVVVVGAINVDYTIAVPALPGPGETVLGRDAIRAWGGKGANQAVAAATGGAETWMIGAVGDDDAGRGALDALRAAGVRTHFVDIVDRPTGHAAIVVDPIGENAIAVAPGANDAVAVPPGPAFPEVGTDTVMLISLEVADDAVLAAARLAADKGWPLIINPAPARVLADEVLDARPLLVPNLHEATTLTGTTDTSDAAAELHRRTTAPVIVTLGSEGALLFDGDDQVIFPAPDVEAVDSTGAGDAFCGALAATMCSGGSLSDAVQAGVAAGTRAVASLGARS